MTRHLIIVALLISISTPAFSAEDRETKVRRDKQELANDNTWIYNDLARAMADAKKANKPLLVVVRCIPCEACSAFDKQLLADDNVVADLLDRFVCVRVVQANGLDLSLFQFDYDQSFHALVMNADRTIYARFGTRSARKEQEDMTMRGLRETLLAALEMHKLNPANQAQLAGKQSKPTDVRVPEEMAGLKGKYGAKLDYEGKVVQSCIHCHQIRDEQRLAYRRADKPIPDAVLFPYPLPDVLGLTMNPDTRTTIAAVAKESLAASAGVRPGDEIASLEGQPLLSTADLQWVLHNLPEESRALAAVIKRSGEAKHVTISLPADWRRQCNISWRPTTWDLRRMATGGLLLEDLTDEQRRERELPTDTLALRVKHVGQYGDHAAAKNAGFQQDDVLVALDGKTDRLTESKFIAATLTHRRGTSLDVKVLRGKRHVDLKLPLQ